MPAFVKMNIVLDEKILNQYTTFLKRGFYRVKRKAIRRTLRSIAHEARDTLRSNKKFSAVPESGTYYGRTYGRLTRSIRHNEESGTVSAGGNDIYHTAIEDSEDTYPIYPVVAPRLKFIWYRISGGHQLTRRYKMSKSRLIVSDGPVFRSGSGFLSRPWRTHTENFPTLVFELAKQEGIVE
jgi:hypothetical protein